MSADQSGVVTLPAPFVTGGLPLTEALSHRRSVRKFSSEPILLYQLSQVLWASQGITDSAQNLRTAPSAGGTYPLEIYVVTGEEAIEGVGPGVYHFEIAGPALSPHTAGDIRWRLAGAALGQDAINVAPVSLVICAVNDRTLSRYSARGERYVYMEAGHVGQNIYLQAAALGLGTVAIGAFKDNEVREILQLDARTRPLYILPLGKPETKGATQ